MIVEYIGLYCYYKTCELYRYNRSYTGGNGKMDDDRCRLVWKNRKDVTKWILQVETYTLVRGWNNNKMLAIGLPDDRVEFLLTMPEEDRKDWSKLKTAILTEYRSDLGTGFSHPNTTTE